MPPRQPLAPQRSRTARNPCGPANRQARFFHCHAVPMSSPIIWLPDSNLNLSSSRDSRCPASCLSAASSLSVGTGTRPARPPTWHYVKCSHPCLCEPPKLGTCRQRMFSGIMATTPERCDHSPFQAQAFKVGPRSPRTARASTEQDRSPAALGHRGHLWDRPPHSSRVALALVLPLLLASF